MTAVDSPKWEWGPAAAGTLVAFALLAVSLGAGVVLFWASNHLPGLAHTLLTGLVIGAIVADLAWMARTGAALWRMRRRRS